MKSLTDMTVAILAGGQSRRFGTQKTAARLGGCSLLEHALSVARRLSDRIVIIGSIDETILTDNIPIFPDILPGNGPLCGIHTALAKAVTPWVAILPCDMPQMCPDIYRILASHRTDTDPVAAVSHTGLEPLVSLWSRSVEPFLRKMLERGQTSPITALDGLRAIRINIPEIMQTYDPAFFLNINTRQDLFEASTSSLRDERHDA